MSTSSEEIESQQDLDFSTNDNVVQQQQENKASKVKAQKRSKTHYSSTKVKARNLLTNVSYRRFKQTDFENLSFIADVLTFLVQNFNPIDLDRKVDLEDEMQMLKFLWNECIPHEFTRAIYKGTNYAVIADPKLTYQKSNKIVIEWLMSEDVKLKVVKDKLKENFGYIHYIYSLLFPKIYNCINHFGIQNKGKFEFAFSVWKLRKQQKVSDPMQQSIKSYLHPAKNPLDYKDRSAIDPNEQQPIDPDQFVFKVSKSKNIIRNDGSAKQRMDQKAAQKLQERKENLKRQLDENSEKLRQMKKIKKQLSSKDK